MRRALTIARIAAVYLLLGFVTTWAVAWGLALLPPGEPDRSHAFASVEDGPWIAIVDATPYFAFGSCRVLFADRFRVDEAPGTRSATRGGIATRARAPLQALLPRQPYSTEPFRWNDLNNLLHSPFLHQWGKRHLPARLAYESPWVEGIDDARGLPFPALWCSWKVDDPANLRPPPAAGKQPALNDLLEGGFPLSNNPPATFTGATRPRALPYYPIWSGLALNTAFYALVFFVVVRLTKSTRNLIRFRRGKCPKCGYDMTATFTTPCPECGHTACRRKIEMG